MATSIHLLLFILGLSVHHVQGNDESVVCPDGTECKNGDTPQTCCEVGDNRYGCCLLPNAVCCADRAHCCPERSICDLKRQRCIPELLLRKKAQKSKLSLGKSTPEHKEFDKLMYLIYNRYDNSRLQSKGCPGCPFSNAVCCSDGLHCCPQNMNCDETGLTCIEKEELTNSVLLTETAAEEIKIETSLPWSKIKLDLKVTDNVCPGGEMKCKDNDTCCQTPTTGSYACCPLPKAACCSDGLHCCPNGMKCDLAHMRCVGLEHHTSLSKTNSQKTNKCPDKKTTCPDETTCCQMASGGYGCCPFSNATCCSDKLHCCPNGFRCDLSSLVCVKGDLTFELGRLLQGEQIKVQSVVCPGGHFKCPDNTTCCELPDGRYGCCPYVHAVCCSDKQHCCPEGTKCDIPHQRCVQERFSFPFATVMFAEKIDDQP